MQRAKVRCRMSPPHSGRQARRRRRTHLRAVLRRGPFDYAPVLLDQAWTHDYIVLSRANMQQFWSRASSVWSEQAASGMVL